eukprot:6200029-Pleurochrysis_carterae.AAC.1
MPGKPRWGAGGPKDCKCGKGARGAKWEGHERGQAARTGSGGELVLKGQSGEGKGRAEETAASAESGQKTGSVRLKKPSSQLMRKQAKCATPVNHAPALAGRLGRKDEMGISDLGYIPRNFGR